MNMGVKASDSNLEKKTVDLELEHLIPFLDNEITDMFEIEPNTQSPFSVFFPL